MDIKLQAALLLLAASSISHANIGQQPPGQQSSNRVPREAADTAAPTADPSLPPDESAAAAFRRGDYEAAARLLRFDAMHGDASAQHNLGFMYIQGLGVERDVLRPVAEADPGGRHHVGVDVVEQLGRIDLGHAEVAPASELGADQLGILEQEQHAPRGVELDHAPAVRPDANQGVHGRRSYRFGFSIRSAMP